MNYFTLNLSNFVPLVWIILIFSFPGLLELNLKKKHIKSKNKKKAHIWEYEFEGLPWTEYFLALSLMPAPPLLIILEHRKIPRISLKTSRFPILIPTNKNWEYILRGDKAKKKNLWQFWNQKKRLLV